MDIKTNTLVVLSNKKRLIYILLFGILTGISILFSISIGTVPVEGRDILSVMTGRVGQETTHQVLYNIRIPRVLIGALAGSNLAVAGALLQGVLRNPLASPQVIGVNAGAGFIAVIFMIVFPGQIGWLPFGAFLGALGAAMMVYTLAHKEGSGLTVNIILAGVAISALFSAFTSGLMILNSNDLEITYTWLLGGLAGRGWTHFRMLGPYSLGGLFLALILSPKLNLFLLGDEVGSSLGLEVKFYRLVFLMKGALLAGSAVSVVGTIGFVGLIAPHLARLFVGNDYRYLLILSALLGACLLVTADTLARLVFQPLELPVGILTAILGAPFFLSLMYKKRNLS